MAASSTRILWKGAISFGLVHIPVALHSATESQSVNFDWLDKRSMEPVGYKRVNKVTGKEVGKENIVKGVEYEDGNYVVLSADEIAAAYPKTTQTVEIQAFVPVRDVPFVYLERPYYVSPINKGAKVYALLREVLRKTGKVGIAKVVIQTKQHLAVLLACGPALILNLLRWDEEIRPWDELDLPAEGRTSTGLTEKEMKMGEQLIEDMSSEWAPEVFTDSFREQILQLVQAKADAGKTQAVAQPKSGTEPTGANIYDLTELLQRSLHRATQKPSTSTKEEAKEKENTQARPMKTASKSAAKSTKSLAKTAKKTTKTSAKPATKSAKTSSRTAVKAAAGS